MDKLRREFYEAIKAKRINPNDPKSRLVMSFGNPPVQQDYDYWYASLFGTEVEAKKTYAIIVKVMNRQNSPDNWVEHYLKDHKKYFVDETTFIKSYCCDLGWAKTTAYCAGGTSPDGGGGLDEYAGSYTMTKSDGTQEKGVVAVEGQTLTTTAKQGKKEFKVILTPTGKKDIFNAAIKGFKSNGTATFTRNPGGQVCSVSGDITVEIPVLGDQTEKLSATKDGVSCSGTTPPPPKPDNQQGSGSSNNQGNTAGGNYPPCVEGYGTTVIVQKVMYKTGELFYFAYNKTDQNKAKQDAQKVIDDAVAKDATKKDKLEIVEDEGVLVSVSDRGVTGDGESNYISIYFKDGTFVSNSSIKRGTYKCVQYGNGQAIMMQKRDMILKETKDAAKQILKEYFIKLTK